MVRKDELVLQAVQNVLNENYDSRYYAINGYEEEIYCLNKVSAKWSVCLYERGNVESERIYTNAYDAVIEFLHLLQHRATVDLTDLFEKELLKLENETAS